MDTVNSWLFDVMTALWQKRCDLGAEAAAEALPTDERKRQTKFELEAVFFMRQRLLPHAVLQAEGWKFHQSAAQQIVGFDPTDGTAGDARFRGIGTLRQGLPVSLVISVRDNIDNSTFASVTHAGILDLRTGQLFVAAPDRVLTYVNGKEQQLQRTLQYNVHAPTVATEIARRALAPLRFLIPYKVYPEMYSDSNSSAMVMLWALLGYCDVWFNCTLPGIEGAGQRGHELGALAVFARTLGACAWYTAVQDGQIVVLGSVDNAPYTFDGQTSVILGVDERIVDHYVQLLNKSLAHKITIGSLYPTVWEVFTALYRDCPAQRWSLPLVP